MKLLRCILAHMVTWSVVAAVAGFVIYSLYFYRASSTVNCSTSAVNQQMGVAVHVIRQWFGREDSQAYACAP